MSKRNFILLIIILVIAVISVFGFLYLQTPAPGEDTGGINFGSIFNPFGSSSPATPGANTPPADVSGYQPEPTTTPEPTLKLKKVSSMPVAGFAAYSKERLIDVLAPTETPVATPVITYNFGTTTLKNGSTGEAVKELQKFLNNTLSLGLELSGIFDEALVAAVKQWQTEHNLIADGIVGAKTKAAMYASVEQKTETTKPAPPPTEFVTALRYVDRSSGNIFQTFADKIQERKFSNTVIPKVYEALFGNNGETVIMRYLKKDRRTIETFVGNLPKELLGGDAAGNSEIKGLFLPENTKDISLSSDKGSIFYLFNSGDNIIGTTLNLSTNKKVQVFDSPFTEWLSWWPNSKIITLTTKPSSSVPGYMYTLDLNNKTLNMSLGNINGLTTLVSPDGKLALYNNNNLSLNLFHIDTKTTEPLGVFTLPEKCVWGRTSDVVYCGVPGTVATGEYPDAWYQGEVSFSDQIWKIDIKTGNTTMIADPVTISGGEDIDGIKLMLDYAENYLFFVNKKDSYLWELELSSAPASASASTSTQPPGITPPAVPAPTTNANDGVPKLPKTGYPPASN